MCVLSLYVSALMSYTHSLHLKMHCDHTVYKPFKNGCIWFPTTFMWSDMNHYTVHWFNTSIRQNKQKPHIVEELELTMNGRCHSCAVFPCTLIRLLPYTIQSASIILLPIAFFNNIYYHVNDAWPCEQIHDIHCKWKMMNFQLAILFDEYNSDTQFQCEKALNSLQGICLSHLGFYHPWNPAWTRNVCHVFLYVHIKIAIRKIQYC